MYPEDGVSSKRDFAGFFIEQSHTNGSVGSTLNLQAVSMQIQACVCIFKLSACRDGW